MMKLLQFASISALVCTLTPHALAQGEDGTPYERNLQIIAEMLPGLYDNANQAYFDRRLKEQTPHGRMSVAIEKADMPSLGDYAFTARLSQGEDAQTIGLSLAADNAARAVRMVRYDISGKSPVKLAGCDMLIRMEAGQFTAKMEAAETCSLRPAWDTLMLSEDALWANLAGDQLSAYTMERARDFTCYVDVPGVGGGRDIPYKRTKLENMHDKGGKGWVSLDDGSEVSITLQNIRWPMNNMNGIFTRHSFVMYVGKKEKGEKDAKEVSYAWTQPNAQRIGMNLKWMLVNCYMLSNENVTPYFKDEPLLP